MLSMESEASIIEKENALLQKELEWILHSHLPTHIRKLDLLINEALEIARGSERREMALKIESNSSIGGHILVRGDLIVGGDLHIKLPGQGTRGVIKTSINPRHPFSIEQLRAIRNSFQRALTALRMQPNFYSQRDVFETLLFIIKVVEASQDVLTRLDQSMCFPEKPFEAKNFIPPLPEDVIVEFYISHSKLITSVSLLRLKLNPITQLTQSTKRLFRRPSLRKPEAVIHNNRPAEVIEHAAVDTPFPFLSDLSKCIDDILEICYDAKIKLEAFL